MEIILDTYTMLLDASESQ